MLNVNPGHLACHFVEDIRRSAVHQRHGRALPKGCKVKLAGSALAASLADEPQASI